MGAELQLTWPQVSAWRLARHRLSRREKQTKMLDVVSKLCCIQAQMMSAAELEITARVEGIKPADVEDALWQKKTLVKTWMLRGTLHLVTAEDLPLYAAAHGALEQWRRGAWLRYHELTEAEMEASLAAVREALDGRRLTREQLADEVARLTRKPALGERLRSGWGELLKPAAFKGWLAFGPSQGQAVTFVRPDQWLGEWREEDTDAAWLTLLRRFLHSYGPAVREEFPRWFGMLPGRKPSGYWKALAAEMVEVDVEGWKAWMLAADAVQIAKLEPPQLVRLLPNFDVYTLGTAPHSANLLDPAYKERVYRKAAWISPVVLVDGRIAGIWKYKVGKQNTALTVELFEDKSERISAGIDAEAARLSELLESPVQVSYGSAL